MGLFGNGGRGGGFNIRWLIAIGIAVVGLITYYTSTQINKVTGEKQRVALTSEQEIALGLEAAPQMVQQMGARVLDPRTNPDAALVEEVGRKLVHKSDAARSDYVQNFNFYLIEDEQINAFALPGGQIFITTTLFNKMENEAQLAGVLGHEIGHVIHRHSAEHMAKGQLGQSMVGAVAVGASDGEGGGQMAAVAAQMANNMLQMKYGRADESESDATGIDYMVDAGYDPRGMEGVMKILKEAGGGGRQPEFLSSHPDPGNRIQAIREIIARNYSEQQLASLDTGRALPGAGGEAARAGSREDGRRRDDRRDGDGDRRRSSDDQDW